MCYKPNFLLPDTLLTAPIEFFEQLLPLVSRVCSDPVQGMKQLQDFQSMQQCTAPTFRFLSLVWLPMGPCRMPRVSGLGA